VSPTGHFEPKLSVNKATNRNDDFNSNRCAKCVKNKLNILKIYVQIQKPLTSPLSRATESMGPVETVLKVWHECSNAYIAAIVTGGDSTSGYKLSQRTAKRDAAGSIMEAK
jgi:hypothetical protein